MCSRCKTSSLRAGRTTPSEPAGMLWPTAGPCEPRTTRVLQAAGRRFCASSCTCTQWRHVGREGSFRTYDACDRSMHCGVTSAYVAHITILATLAYGTRSYNAPGGIPCLEHKHQRCSRTGLRQSPCRLNYLVWLQENSIECLGIPMKEKEDPGRKQLLAPPLVKAANSSPEVLLAPHTGGMLLARPPCLGCRFGSPVRGLGRARPVPLRASAVAAIATPHPDISEVLLDREKIAERWADVYIGLQGREASPSW